MARFLSDQTKLVMFYESGTYGALQGTGQWPTGYVQDYDFVESQNTIQTRFLGQLNRNVGRFDFGALDVKGTINLYPQDWRLLAFTLGSATRTSGTAQTSNYRYDIAEVNGGTRGNAYTSGTLNPFVSFTLEESRTGATANQNFMRTLVGCNVDVFKLTVNQGEPVKAQVSVLTQAGSWFSGTSTTITAGSNRPYLWSDTVFQPLTSGTTMEPVKNLVWTIKNNFVGPHYLNGSRVIAIPYPLNRDYDVKVIQDLESSIAGSLYDSYFKGGSIFNAILDINNQTDTGSHRLIVTFSGCRMTDMTVPAKIGGLVECNYSFVPGSVSAIAHDRLEFYSPF